MLAFVIKFNLVSHISEDYVSTAIARIAKHLRLSESLAGATLLAMANGCTDIVTVIQASLTGSHNNDLAIGSLFGAGLFTGTIVLAFTIMASAGFVVGSLDKCNIVIDLSFMLAGVSVFVLLGSLNLPMIYTGVGMMVVYLLYLATIVTL